MFRREFTLVLALSLCCSGSLCAQLPKTETKSGTVKELVTKGRSTSLILTGEDGTDHEFMLTPKVVFEVHGNGDEGFVAPGQLVKGTGVLTNERLIVSEVSIYLLGPGKKAPPGKIAKSPAVEGASMNSYDFMGEIVALKQDEDYPDYQQLGLKITGKIPPIMLEKGFAIQVVSPSVELAKAGMPVEFEVAPLRGGKFTLVRVTVTADDGFKSAELLKPAAKK